MQGRIVECSKEGWGLSVELQVPAGKGRIVECSKEGWGLSVELQVPASKVCINPFPAKQSMLLMQFLLKNV